ncbi:DUF2167 domain-containing protein [Flavihumibacter fluvii]|uniref:DUF2167 domain-containing protein n=1 Tax=Flavihumibacter fluvii TaxID=2838157 RepID=UPI001BDF25A5|nr:DUF2167 domain-containing protein [Flavihumibacter fluvii]ULQ52296.1 DUF2167 domain-containing protein [Flavihumibacter fluvii]
MLKPVITGFFILNALFAAADPADSAAITPKDEAPLYKQFNKQLDSAEQSIEYMHGVIALAGGRVKLTVPEGFKFINAEQSRYILEDLWGNMEDKDVYGMLVKDNFKVTRLVNDYSFVISFSDIGYVPDNIDTDLDHAELLETLKSNMDISNENRITQGINTMTIEGWALVPYYDAYKKAVYWANQIGVNGTDEKILNYNLRLLGKTGVIKINAVATMDQFPEIKQVLPMIITQARFESGEKYVDFVKGKDTPGEWTITELVAGNRNSHGFWSSLYSNWKLWLALIAFGVAGYAGFSILKKTRLTMANAQ